MRTIVLSDLTDKQKIKDVKAAGSVARKDQKHGKAGPQGNPKAYKRNTKHKDDDDEDREPGRRNT